MAEGTSLLRMHTAYTCIVSSNLTVSARTKKNGLPAGGHFFLFGRRRARRPRGFEDPRVLARGSPNRPSSAAARRGARGAASPPDTRSLRFQQRPKTAVLHSGAGFFFVSALGGAIRWLRLVQGDSAHRVQVPAVSVSTTYGKPLGRPRS